MICLKSYDLALNLKPIVFNHNLTGFHENKKKVTRTQEANFPGVGDFAEERHALEAQ